MSEMLALGRIRTDGGTQPRAILNQEVVQEYAEAIQNGDKFPELIVFYDGEAYWLVDGFHRFQAYKEIKQRKVPCLVKQGSHRDAVLESVGVNAKHGLRRTNEDKRRAVLKLLEDEKWGKWSDHEIARKCNVSQPFVLKIRKVTNNIISENPKQRTYIDKHGNESTMDTSNLGRRSGSGSAMEGTLTSEDTIFDDVHLCEFCGGVYLSNEECGCEGDGGEIKPKNRWEIQKPGQLHVSDWDETVKEFNKAVESGKLNADKMKQYRETLNKKEEHPEIRGQTTAVKEQTIQDKIKEVNQAIKNKTVTKKELAETQKLIWSASDAEPDPEKEEETRQRVQANTPSRIARLNGRMGAIIDDLTMLADGSLEVTADDRKWVKAIIMKGPNWILQFHKLGVDLKKVYNTLINPKQEIDYESKREEGTEWDETSRIIDITPVQQDDNGEHLR